MRLVDALLRNPVDRPPVWFMRQAGRYLPEYRRIRETWDFQSAVHTPAVAAEITVQPVARFGLDAAIIFSDIMTALEGLGVQTEFDPGPKVSPHAIADVARFPSFDADRVSFVADAIGLVRSSLDPETAVIGFAGGPVTLLSYLLEGGGSKEFMAMRAALVQHPDVAEEALQSLGRAMNQYLRSQIDGGANAVQLFDSWAGLLPRDVFVRFAAPAAKAALEGLDVPTIYFAPGAGHLLDLVTEVGADAYGVDWRVPIPEAWQQIGHEHAIQGNLDPAVLLSNPETVTAETAKVVRGAERRPGYVFNLGHGIHRTSPLENVAAMVAAVKERT